MGAHRQKRSNNSNGSTTERGISSFAGRRLHLINAEQLHSIGLSRSSINHRVSSGRLHRLHAGVYATHPPPYSRAQRWAAAVLACGPGALLSDLPAAALTGISEATPGAAQVSAPTGRGRSRAGIVVHRRQVDRRDVRRVRGVPCTSADRILIDLAPADAEAELESTMVAADSLQIRKRHHLAELAAERRGRPGGLGLPPLRPAADRRGSSRLGGAAAAAGRGAGGGARPSR